MTTRATASAREQFEKLFAVEPPMSHSEFLSNPEAIEFAARRGVSLGEAWAEINAGCQSDPRRVRGALRFRLVQLQAAQLEQALRR